MIKRAAAVVSNDIFVMQVSETVFALVLAEQELAVYLVSLHALISLLMFMLE